MKGTLKFLLRNQLKRSQSAKQAAGFTLIELLVAMVLAFLVITPLMGFMVDVMRTDQQEQVKADTEQEIQASLDYISRDLKQAIYIYDATGITAIKDQLPSLPTGVDRVPVLVFWKREFINQAITSADSNKDDTFVYSLVAYYLTKDANKPMAKIARWAIKDGVPNSTDNPASPGFAPFNLSNIGTLEEKMNQWEKSDDAYTNSPVTLVEYIDQTKTDDTTNPAPAAACTTSVPSGFSALETYKMTGFYACIDRVNTTAQVFLRGNALARIDNNANNVKYTDGKKTYFPNVSVKVQGRSYLFTK
jgi:type II secretory pathway component PulJ